MFTHVFVYTTPRSLSGEVRVYEDGGSSPYGSVAPLGRPVRRAEPAADDFTTLDLDTVIAKSRINGTPTAMVASLKAAGGVAIKGDPNYKPSTTSILGFGLTIRLTDNTIRVVKTGRFDPNKATVAGSELGVVYNEMFHAWYSRYEGAKETAWLRVLMQDEADKHYGPERWRFVTSYPMLHSLDRGSDRPAHGFWKRTSLLAGSRSADWLAWSRDNPSAAMQLWSTVVPLLQSGDAESFAIAQLIITNLTI